MKRTLLILAFVLLWSSSAFAAPTSQVQCIRSAEGSTASSWTAAITATTHNAFVVSVQFVAIDGTNDITGISDGVNTYTQVDTHTAVYGGLNTRISTYYAKDITGGSLTLTTSASTSQTAIARTYICEVAGADLTSPLGVHAIQTQVTPGTGTDLVTSGNVTTTENGDYIFAATLSNNGGETFSAGTGFNVADTITSWMASEYRVQSSAGPIAGTFTAAFGDLHTFSTAVVALKPAGGGGATPHNLLTLGAGD